MKRLALLTLITVFSTQSLAQSNFGIAELKAMIASKRIQSVEELLPELPAQFRKKSVVMLESMSLQAAEISLPRVLIFGTGDFVISFNGHPKQRGYEGIETLRYDWNKHSFILEEVVFPKDLEQRKSNVENRLKSNDPTLSPLEPMELEDRSSREGSNPSLCLQCHGKRPGPILPRFPYGAGMLGGYTGTVETRAKWFKDLQSSFAQNPRYRSLLENQDQLANLSLQQSLNREFNLKLAERHWDQLAYLLIKKGPAFDQFKFALLAALNNCSDLEKYVAPANAALLSGSLQSLEQATFLSQKSAISHAQDRAAALRFMPPTGLENDSQILRQSEMVAKVRLVIEKGMRINMSESFTMDGALESYDFITAGGGIEQLFPHLIRLMQPSSDPAAMVIPNSSLTPALYCDRLLEKARTAVTGQN